MIHRLQGCQPSISACLVAMDVPLAPTSSLRPSTPATLASTTESDAAIAACLAAMEASDAAHRNSPSSVRDLSLASSPVANASGEERLAALGRRSRDKCGSTGRSTGRITRKSRSRCKSKRDGESRISSSPQAEEEECVACLDLQANVCLIPCGHVCLCTSCAEKLPHPKTCPMCRMAIEQTVQTAQRAR